ncbi:hypothetical protein QAD02_020833 [Eretmocerus hayati]|uniref:Uncharacterized protein n=1 Tax=Eretmocerus hayati TaxID=131215 RepID=A0ACC2PNP8_9HYME|nr:hypothetical protein QAD02_020833 [Eretmocerus hayati]
MIDERDRLANHELHLDRVYLGVLSKKNLNIDATTCDAEIVDPNFIADELICSSQTNVDTIINNGTIPNVEQCASDEILNASLEECEGAHSETPISCETNDRADFDAGCEHDVGHGDNTEDAGVGNEIPSVAPPNKGNLNNFLEKTDAVDPQSIPSNDCEESFNIHIPAEVGRCISDPIHFYQDLLKMQREHGEREQCNFHDITYSGFHKLGLNTKIRFKCNKCGYYQWINLIQKKDKTMCINQSAAIGSVCAGIGYTESSQYLAALGIKNMSHVSYRKKRVESYNLFKQCSEESMKQAIEEEKELARMNGDVINGIPFITVIVDGSWGKRSYKSGKYNSASGCGVIIGARTKKVLYVGVKNKYCYTCTRAANRKKTPSAGHVHFQNWGANESSSSMEKAIILEGFAESLSKHGVMYKIIIADGDSSVFKAISDSQPYRQCNVRVQKVECTNHLLRNLCNKIKDASKSRLNKTKLRRGSVTSFRAVVGNAALKVRRHVVNLVRIAMSYERSRDNEQLLQKQILDSVNHCFGDHRNCDELNTPCEIQDNERNWVPDLKSTGIYDQIRTAVSNLSCHAKSLLCNVTNNAAEGFNNVVAKMNGGKRVNYSARESYELRVLAAVIQYNDLSVFSSLLTTGEYDIPMINQLMEERHKRQIATNKALRIILGRRKIRTASGEDADYGGSPSRPDIDESAYEVLKEDLLRRLKNDQANKLQLFEMTKYQSECDKWHELRSERCCSSNFGRVCRMRPSTSRANAVKNILYPPVSDLPAFRHGLENEDEARQRISQRIGKVIGKAGLTIGDGDEFYLGSSVDGIIDDDGVLEMKIPLSAKDLTFKEAMKQKPHLRRIFDKSSLNKMNPVHEYYHQVQGQLHILKRDYCIFALVTGNDIHLVNVERDDDFWNQNMAEPLRKFYFDCLLPEIIDSRYNRSMPLREPDYVIEAQKVLREKNREKLLAQSEIPETPLKEKTPSKVASKKNVKPQRRYPARAISRSSPNSHEITSNAQGNVSPISANNEASNENQSSTSPNTKEDEEDKILRNLYNTVDLNNVLNNVLNCKIQLEDDDIHVFQQLVLSKTSRYEIHPPVYFKYPERLPEKYKNYHGKTHLQIIGGHDEYKHWICYRYDGDKLLIYDSLNRKVLHKTVKNYFKHRYPMLDYSKITFVKVTRQPDLNICGVFACGFMTHIVLGQNPSQFCYCKNSQMMRNHVRDTLVSGELRLFPRDESIKKIQNAEVSHVDHTPKSLTSKRPFSSANTQKYNSGAATSINSADIPTCKRAKAGNIPARGDQTFIFDESSVAAITSKRGTNNEWVSLYDGDIEMGPTITLRELPPRSRENNINYNDNRVILLQDILECVYNKEMKLNDDTLDYFLRILIENAGGFSVQSVNYVYKLDIVEPTDCPAIQIIGGDATDHWRTILFADGKLHVYDSIPGFGTLCETEMNYVMKRFPNLSVENILYHKMNVRQKGVKICGALASAFAVSGALGVDPYEIPKIAYENDDALVRRHMGTILITRTLLPFPTKTAQIDTINLL